MRKLFVSFTATLRHLKDGTLTPEDLSVGLFYFGCVREHVFEEKPMEVDWFFREDIAEGQRAIHFPPGFRSTMLRHPGGSFAQTQNARKCSARDATRS